VKGKSELGELEEKPGLGFLLPIALVSFSLLAYEIVLSRLLSVLLSYHFVFLILSLALLGLGLGGLFLYLLSPSEPPGRRGPGTLIPLGAALSLAIPASCMFMAWLAGLEGLGQEVLCYVPALLIPFALGGAFLAQVYRLLPESSGRTYGADLIGAAAGAPGAILLLELLGAMGAPMLLGIMVSSGVVLLALPLQMGNPPPRAGRLGAISLVLCILLGSIHWSSLASLETSPQINPEKEIHEALTQFKGKILQSRWSSFGRTDLVAYDEDSPHMDLYLDGTAGSPMYRFSGNLGEPQPWLAELQEEFPGALPLSRLAGHERDSALIIGPGGGRDVLLTLLAGVREIEAVEINPDLVKIVRETAGFNGGIYQDFPGVKVIVEEGRSYLRRQKKKYDLIFMSLPVTNTSRSIEGYSLTENYLFTLESMTDYWDHLTEEGRLVVVAHNDAELLRLVTITLGALKKRGLETQAAMSRIWVLSSGDYLVLVLRKTPFEPEDAMWAFREMLQRGYHPSESFLPFLSPTTGLNPALASLASGRLSLEGLVEQVARKGYDISPVSDESPFFYKLEPGVPGAVVTVLCVSLGLLMLVGAALGLRRKKIFFLGGKESTRGTEGKPRSLRVGILFCALGAGFILVEIYAIQRFCLVIGQPVWTMGAVIFSMLISGGMGSLWAGSMGRKALQRRIWFFCLLISGLLLAYGVFLDLILKGIQGWPQGARLAGAVLSLAPLGFLMGIPFPLGIRALGLGAQARVIPWMWALNGISSVAGSSLSILLAIQLGFTWVLVTASLCYFLGFLAFLRS